MKSANFFDRLHDGDYYAGLLKAAANYDGATSQTKTVLAIEAQYSIIKVGYI
jgi:hypothetical protein